VIFKLNLSNYKGVNVEEKDGIESLLEDEKMLLGTYKSKLNELYESSKTHTLKFEIYNDSITKKILQEEVKNEISVLFSIFENFYGSWDRRIRLLNDKQKIYDAYTKPDIPVEECHKLLEKYFLEHYEKLP